jgi:hypothetical protein
MDEDRRHAARDRAATIWFAGYALGLIGQVVDLPRALRIPVAVAWGAALAAAALQWIMLAVRDGSLARAVPDYLWAAVALAGIALACAGSAIAVLLIAARRSPPTAWPAGR